MICFPLPLQQICAAGVQLYYLATLLKKRTPIATARPTPIMVSPAGSAVWIIVKTSVLIVATAVLKASVTDVILPSILLSPFLVISYQ